MRIHELYENEQAVIKFNNAWTNWVLQAGNIYNSNEQAEIKRSALSAVGRGSEPADAIGTAAEIVRSKRAQANQPASVDNTDSANSSKTAKSAKPKAKFKTADSDFDIDIKLPKAAQWLKDKLAVGSKFADKYTKVNKK